MRDRALPGAVGTDCGTPAGAIERSCVSNEDRLAGTLVDGGYVEPADDERYRCGVGYYLVTESHGPAWDAGCPRRAQEGFHEHAAFMDALVDEGTILLGGPVGDDVDTGDALLVVAADNEAAVHAALAADPWQGTVLSTTRVQLWSLWLRPPAV